MFIEPLPNEKEILQRLQTGDEYSFSIFYRHYYLFILGRVQRMMHSPELAEDVTQEIFMKIWEGRSKLVEIKSFSSYLFIIARNHTINVLKTAARSDEGMGEIIRHISKTANATEDEIQNNEYLKFIRQKLEELPPRSKEIFLLCREQSKSYREVATALGISRDAVKSRMVHAMKLLRNSAESEMGLTLVLILTLINLYNSYPGLGFCCLII
jgi:RNA polymerase sigma-70 factor (ECF subfamily)